MPLGLSIRNAKKKQIEDLRDKKICTYCGTGYRGNIAADELVKERFNAVTLEGGYTLWNHLIFLFIPNCLGFKPCNQILVEFTFLHV